MGAVIKKKKDNTRQILVLGLAGAGKSFLLKKLLDLNMDEKDIKEVQLESTLGFNQIKIDYLSKELTLWDIGGDQITRMYWATFYRNIKVDKVIFIINLCDEENNNNSLKELLNCINEEELKAAKFFVLFNYILEDKDQKKHNAKETKFKEDKELLIEDLKENLIYDMENRLEFDLFDISKLKQGEIKSIELMNKMFGVKKKK